MPPPPKPFAPALDSTQHRTSTHFSPGPPPTSRIPDHVAYLHPRSQWDTLLHMSLHSRRLGTSPGIVQPADSYVNGHVPNDGTLQLVQLPPVDLPRFRFYPSKILQAPGLGQDRRPPAAFVDILRWIPFPGHHAPDLHLASDYGRTNLLEG